MKSNKAPVFSVVIPMFNVENYIDQSIQSVLCQDYDNFELICIDDGCQDETVSRVLEYKDPRIRLISQKNGGLSAARNTGIRNSRGLYVAFLDADDYWREDKLKKHLEHFEGNPKLGLSYSASLFVDEEGEEIGLGQFPKLTNIQANDIFCRNPIGNGSAPVLRRTALNQIAFVNQLEQQSFDHLNFFDESLRQSEDVDCWLRLALSTQWEIEGLADALCYYRINSNGLSRNLSKQYQSWKLAIEKHQLRHSVFYNKYYSLANAYQLRYLARRAVMNGNSVDAIFYMAKALASNISILIQEPGRTLVTMAGALATVLPKSLFLVLQDLVFSRKQLSEPTSKET